MSLTSPSFGLTDIDAYENETRKFHVFGNAYLRFNIMEGLKFTTTFSRITTTMVAKVSSWAQVCQKNIHWELHIIKIKRV
ncbi:MAG: hypothetical protein R2738_08900 [Bacteroides graminisolvens]